MNKKKNEKEELKVEDFNIPWNEQEWPLDTDVRGDSISDCIMNLNFESVKNFITIIQFFQKINYGFFDDDKWEEFKTKEPILLADVYYSDPDHFDDGKRILGGLVEQYINPQNKFIVLGVIKRLVFLPNHVENAVSYAFEMINSQKENVEDWFPF